MFTHHVSDSAVADWLSAASNHLGAAAKRRNAVMHARPATVDGQQRLYRWKLADRRGPTETRLITPESLANDIAAIETSVRELNWLLPPSPT